MCYKSDLKIRDGFKSSPGLRGGLSKGLRGAIAQGHHKIGGTTLADCRMDILVAYIIFLKGTYIYGPIILINLT